MDPRIARALADIHTQLARPVSMAALARDANLSVSRFRHLFRREVGTSPARYIHALRMIRAQLLLERTSLPVKVVMAQVGCQDPSHFGRDFRKFHGVSPREWRTAAERRSLRGANSETVERASVARTAFLANQRGKRTTRPPPRPYVVSTPPVAAAAAFSGLAPRLVARR